MADDGMLLNFAVNQDSFKSAPKIKGGSWKDRLVAKKLARRGKDSRAPLPLSGPNSQRLQPRNLRNDDPGDTADFPQPRNVKRRRQDGEFKSSADFVPSSKTIDAKASGATQAPRGDRPVISSLFSYNPKPLTQPAEEAVTETEPVKATNAPLIDGLDTFTSLGLSPTLAAHLLTKLNLKDPTSIQKAAITQLLKEDADAFIQSETGSGKTLAYLLPLVQRIMNLKSTPGHTSGSGTNVHRDSGLFAIILAPTRELCKQISVVLERVLNCAHWIVAGTVIGGEKKKSEKARLRKGINILVATPGRLADHLDNTKVLNISTVRWLILDEGDRLMDLGFEEEIQKIVAKLDERQRPTPKVTLLPSRRTTILCSATMKMNVQRLGEISLKDANLIRSETSNDDSNAKKDTAFLAPAQLKQSYTIVPAKLRLVTLIALLKRTFARKGSVMKAIVFVSCADSVDFHFDLFTQPESVFSDSEDLSTSATTKEPSSNSSRPTKSKHESSPSKSKDQQIPTAQDPSASVHPSPLLTTSPNTPLILHKLHGSLPQKTRTYIIQSFTKSTEPSLLICTDVASRGLDLPNLDLVIEYDPAFSSEDHLHRIGRTARLGRDGRAIIFLLPGSEESYTEVLKTSYRDTETASLTHISSLEILKRGFTSNNPQSTTSTTTTSSSTPQTPKFLAPTITSTYETHATNLQLLLERHILSAPQSLTLARKAYQSHIRAYATHTSSERRYFDIKNLHLGHLAKSFGLRDKPSGIGMPGRNSHLSTTSSPSTSTGSAANGKKRRATTTITTTSSSSGATTAVNSTNNTADSQSQNQISRDLQRKFDLDNLVVNGTEKEEQQQQQQQQEEMIRKKKMRSKMRDMMMMSGTGAGEFNIA
ncbi:putative atp-dependent rna helicase dbp7 [Phaeomoniella chlamydospora]|uniref:ATP-dependent RNA helicase n=1 Tax=Phaeomoniella chlamydospora TaxID=158046 RepID=A0A0G2DYF7_PHACM|nr:putative atp-dependent rna helicase dbp7 [Phaeomoniella chlamydospora]